MTEKTPQEYFVENSFAILIVISIIALILNILFCAKFSHTSPVKEPIERQNLSQPPQTDTQSISPSKSQSSSPSGFSSGSCIDVEGTVFGDITPGSNVFLYETSSLDYKTVMTEIRTKNPAGVGTVNESERFVFTCLGPGRYAFVIPASSFNNAVGSPLPYEFDCRNLSLSIEFQGGDWEYSVGAFSIEDSSLQNKSACNKSIEFCRAERGGLYRECPLG